MKGEAGAKEANGSRGAGVNCRRVEIKPESDVGGQPARCDTAGEPQVEQLGASSSLGSLRGVCQESRGKSLSSNKWSVNTVCHMQMNPI